MKMVITYGWRLIVGLSALSFVLIRRELKIRESPNSEKKEKENLIPFGSERKGFSYERRKREPEDDSLFSSLLTRKS